MARHLVTESAAFFARLFQDCPEEFCPGTPRRRSSTPWPLSASDFPAFADRCRWLARYCAALDEAHPATPVLRGELEMLLALAEYNDIAAMSVRHRRAWNCWAAPRGCIRRNPPGDVCPSVLFMFHRESGKLREEIRLMRECMPHYYKAADWHGAGGELLFEAEALYMAGDFTEALRLCRQAETVAALHGQLCNTLCALFLRARLALARKNTSTACAAVREMRDLITKKQDYFLLHTAEVCAARLSGLLRRPDEIPAWVHEGRGERMYAFAQGDFRLAQGRALLLAGDAAAVLGLFHALLQPPLFDKHRLFFIYAHIFLAAAHAMLDAREKALESLRAALDAALPDDVLMPFVENADLVLPLLLAPQETRHEDGVRRILALAEPWLRHLGLPGTRASEIPFGLSVKQYEIARLAAQDAPAEIACRVGLGLNTVKTHLKTVYRKCGANNRPN
ncbi:MAG: helix-turn-helix transcriptional regulator [Bilophila wadsworthia]